MLFKILIENCLRLHEKRASPPRRDLTIVYPRSRLIGLEMSYINATEGAGLLVGRVKKPPYLLQNQLFEVFFRLKYLALGQNSVACWLLFENLLGRI